MKRASITAVLVVLLAGAVTAVAALPSVTTGGTASLTSSSVTLKGSVNPNGEATTYHFDYGTTTAYGSRTPDAALPAVRKKTNVTAGVTGLAAGTTYHYRLVAVNASGTRLGGDRTFTTGAGLGLRPSSSRTVFGRTVVLSGTLSGTGVSGVQVKLQENPYPFAGFKNTLTTTTDTGGRYAFNVKPTVNTRYRTETAGRPPATSPVVTLPVAPSISLRLRRSGSSLRATGTVAPAHNGLALRIQRRTSRGWRTVRRTLLSATSDPARSRYSTRIRRRSGLYRAYFSADADHASGASARRRVR